MGFLDGRVVVATGAGRGIGEAVVKRLASEGAKVVVNDLGTPADHMDVDPGPAQSVVQSIIDGGGIAVADHSDVGDFHAAERLINRAIDEFGRLDVLINVAGIQRLGPIYDMSEENWDTVNRVHMRGTFNTTRHASVYWRSTRDEPSRRLINFSSIAGLYGTRRQANYAAAKMGILGFTYSCAHALGRYGVTANAIAPLAETRMGDQMKAAHPERQRSAEENAKRTPAHIAPLLVYLASKRSDWCTGRILGTVGNRITLYTNPAPFGEVSSDGPWDLGELGDAMEELFRDDPANPTLTQRQKIRKFFRGM